MKLKITLIVFIILHLNMYAQKFGCIDGKL